ncbi:MAG: hypothetical protein A2177_05065 [Spirochaetes bacterium RBG_13_68_11]|nr:MAG: hypothetical protein A2177_05065 [Spirochaetes bacterium RBG_13_68_11]
MGVDIITAIDRKGADVARIADTVIRSPALVPRLLEALEERKARVKYGAEKVLRAVSERRPDLLYPYFADFVRLLDVENSFIKWGVIRTFANLSAADTDNRVAGVFRKFFAPLTGPDMVTAVTITGGGATMARAKPAMTNRIAKEILKVETAAYEMHGAPSPECRAVACGQAIDALDALYEGISRNKPVIEFVRRQLRSTRPAVRRKAEAFLSKHSP